MRFQSTHPSGVRLCSFDLAHGFVDISIHAPQWGATDCAMFSYFFPLFQSTHPSGVRRWILLYVGIISDFNPRTPVGCDRHAHRSNPPGFEFQSTHPSGVRLGHLIDNGNVNQISIHAPQWGATARGNYRSAHGCYFNPRTPVGCDHTRVAYAALRTISIHAPQWGATYLVGKLSQGFLHFNPRTPVGCDPPTLMQCTITC